MEIKKTALAVLERTTKHVNQDYFGGDKNQQILELIFAILGSYECKYLPVFGNQNFQLGHHSLNDLHQKQRQKKVW